MAFLLIVPEKTIKEEMAFGLALVWAHLNGVYTQDKKASMVSVFLARTTSLYPPKFKFPVVGLFFTVVTALCTARR